MILQAKDIKVSFKTENQQKLFGKERQTVLSGVSLDLKKGECLGIIGESGSGKSTLGKVLCGLLKPDSGSIQINGEISIVFQDYTSSVNPRFRMKDVVGEALRVKYPKMDKPGRKEKTLQLLAEVGLDETFLNRYPHQLSGGQLQRVCIARAVALEPDILLLDEAVSSLDAATQVQVMDLLAELRAKHNLSYLFITHDLMTVTYLCDRVIFMKDGQIEEQVDSIDRLPHIQSLYARQLLSSIPRPESNDKKGTSNHDTASGHRHKAG